MSASRPNPDADRRFMQLALRLARRGVGRTSPNPAVGAVLVREGRIVGRGWHRRAGWPHAEVEAIADARRQGIGTRGTTLYVTLEPCCTQGRTPPCTEAIAEAGIRRVVAAAIDPNPIHRGRGFRRLRRRGIRVETGLLSEAATRLNEPFNHWIVHGTPLVTVKAAMTLDGKIGTATGESKWITGPEARREAMRLRKTADAILVGIETVLADDPSLTIRRHGDGRGEEPRRAPLRVVLDGRGRTPLTCRLVNDAVRERTVVVLGRRAPARRKRALASRVMVWTAPERGGRIDVRWVLRRLGAMGVTSLLVEGGGEVNASFLMAGLAQRIAFFIAPTILGGSRGRRAVGGEGARSRAELRQLRGLSWRRCGEDLLLRAGVEGSAGRR